MHYVQIFYLFDIRELIEKWYRPICALLAGVVPYVYSRRACSLESLPKVGALAYLVLGLCLFVAMALPLFLDYIRILAGIVEGHEEIVRGPLYGLKQDAFSGKVIGERFCVADKCFHYEVQEPSASFTNSSSIRDGYPLRNGLLVRITHVDNAITRFELAPR